MSIVSGTHRCRRKRVKRLGQRGFRSPEGRRKSHRSSTTRRPVSPLSILQFNAGSVYANLEEIRFRVSKEHPDVVLIQETQLPAGSTVKIPGYSLINQPRKTPRNGENIRGGGVAILVTTTRIDLTFWELTCPRLDPDVTSEIVAIRLYLNTVVGLRSLDIVNLYVPPIHGGSQDSRRQFFSADRTFLPFIKGVETSADSLGLIVAGDVNAHALEWDIYSTEDRIGLDIIDFLDGNGFTVWNDGLPTFHTNESRTAPDVTFSMGEVAIQNWSHRPPIGQCHHDSLSYEVSVDSVCRPLTPHRRQNVYRTSISWRKVDWPTYNNETRPY